MRSSVHDSVCTTASSESFLRIYISTILPLIDLTWSVHILIISHCRRKDVLIEPLDEKLINPANVEDQVGLDGYQSPSSTPHAPDPQPFYRSAPPRYPPLCGRRARELGVTHNLMDSFVAMTAASVSSCRRTDAGKVDAQQGYGEVMDITGFVHWLSDGRE